MSSKHILYLTQYYLTEKEGGGQRHFEHVKRLVKEGYKVTVVTCYVDYIKRQIPPQYAGQKTHLEVVNPQLSVYRTYGYPGYGKDVFSRIRNMVSYSWNAYLVGRRIKDISYVLASSPPLTLGLTGAMLAVKNKARFIFEVRDLWPDTPVNMGTLKNKFLIAVAKVIEKISYNNADDIIVLTQGIQEGVAQKIHNRDKIHFIPNGADYNLYAHVQEEWLTTETLIRHSKDEFIVTYAGVHSSYPDLQNFIQAMKLLEHNKGIRAVLVGDGDNKPQLVRMVKELKLTNVTFLDQQPKEKIPEILGSSHVCLISYQNLEMWRGALPNKVFDYMASGRPLLASVPEGEITALVKQANCGVCVEPSNPQALAEKIVWCRENYRAIKKLGENGKLFVFDNFSRDKIFQGYLEIFTV